MQVTYVIKSRARFYDSVTDSDISSRHCRAISFGGTRFWGLGVTMPLISYYLPLRARAEAQRMILEYGEIPHECINYSFQEWGSLKTSGEICHFGQLPSIKTADGAVISQSGAIVRYVAKLANIYPQDPLAAAQTDMIFELSQEMNLINPLYNFYQVDSPEWKEKHDSYFASVPAWITSAQKILGDKEYFAGTKPSYGDFGLFHICETIIAVQPESLDPYPSIKAWIARMNSLPAVQSYKAKRPGPSTPGFGIPGTFIMSKQ